MKEKQTVDGRSRHRRTDPFQRAGLGGYDAVFEPMEVSARQRRDTHRQHKAESSA
jgi:hypothetical protein